MTETTKPVHTIRLGTIQAAIWSNAGQHGPFYNVTFERRFRDVQEEWQSSGSFGRDDLLVLAKLADEAHSFIFTRQAAERGQPDPTDNGSMEPVNPANAAKADASRRRAR